MLRGTVKAVLLSRVCCAIEIQFLSSLHCSAACCSSLRKLQYYYVSARLGPAAFLVGLTAADLRHIHDGNEILKYADDTYLVIPAANTRTCPDELIHNNIEACAATNNMQLNNAKTKEIVFRSRSKRG